MNSSTTASAEVGLRLVVPGSATVPLLAALEYSSADPYALRVAFHAGGGEPVEWIFARELLTVGLVRRAGDGDVQIWPSDESTLNIGLSSPFGSAHFEGPMAPLAEFLSRTHEMVPAGREPEFIDIEAELDDLFWHS